MSDVAELPPPGVVLVEDSETGPFAEIVRKDPAVATVSALSFV